MSVRAEGSCQFLVHTFSLAVGFGMVPRSEADIDIKLLEKGGPDSGSELRTPVGHNVLRQAVEVENRVAQELRGF